MQTLHLRVRARWCQCTRVGPVVYGGAGQGTTSLRWQRGVLLGESCLFQLTFCWVCVPGCVRQREYLGLCPAEQDPLPCVGLSPGPGAGSAHLSWTPVTVCVCLSPGRPLLPRVLRGSILSAQLRTGKSLPSLQGPSDYRSDSGPGEPRVRGCKPPGPGEPTALALAQPRGPLGVVGGARAINSLD